MATTLPSAADLGVSPQVTGERPVASYDVSGVARGGAAMAKAGQDLGKGVADVGGAIGDVELDKARYQYATANAKYLSDSIDLQTQFAHDQDYTTLPQRFADAHAKVLDNAASSIDMPGMRARFVQIAQPEVARTNAQMQQKAFGLEGDANKAYVGAQGDKFINQGAANPSDTTLQGKLIGAYGSLVDGLAGRGFISQEAALDAKQKWSQQYAIANGTAAADSGDPGQIEGALNELRTAPGSPQQIDNRIVQIESGGNLLARSKTSNAAGLGQFEPATWLPLMRANHPEFADKPDSDVLAMRADRGLNMEMLARNREQNTAYLQKNGVEANAGNVYLAHFLGPAGAAAVAKAQPGMPVADVLAGAVGKDTAAKMIAANPTILQGQTAGSVAQWAHDKMGGVGPGGGHIYDLLRPDQREVLATHLQAALDKHTVLDKAAFGARVANSQAEALNGEAPSQPIDQGEFIARYGTDEGAQRYAAYNEQLQVGRTTNAMYSMAPADRQAVVDHLKPEPGDPNYALKSKAYSIAQGAQQTIDEALKKDPASYAARKLPASKEAFRAFQDASTADDATRGAAAQKYAAVTLADQTRVGVSSDLQRVAPQPYVDHIGGVLQKAATADDPQARVALIGQVHREAAMWGQYWPQVMQQLAPGMQPVARAIAAGADPNAMTRLLRLDPKDTPKTLLADQPAGTATKLSTAVGAAMATFKGTLLPTQRDGSNSDFKAYEGMTGKLAALYMQDGTDADTAAATAFNKLVGSRYDFRDGYRIPKSAGVAPDDVQAGALEARDQLEALGVRPPVDTMPGRTDATAVDFDLVGRNSRWITSPNNDGLNLVYDSNKDGRVFLQDRSGKRLMLSWAKLGELGKKLQAGRADIETRAAIQ